MAKIKKISTIKKFGLFKNFDWDGSVRSITGEVICLGDINVFFGRNYSGKSTIARILRAFERQCLPSHYDSGEFTIELDDGTIITSANLNQGQFKVRVFTQDFIYDNLSFLMDTRDDIGEIVPFAIIGEDNNRITTQIKAIKDELGNNDEGLETGLYKKLREAKEQYDAKVYELSEVNKHYDADLRKVALDKNTGIKYKSELYGDVNYTITKLECDLQEVISETYIKPTDESLDRAKQVIQERQMPLPSEIVDQKFSWLALMRHTKALLEKDVVSSEKIAELVRDAMLESWVKQGVEYHEQHGHDRCRFCGQLMPTERWSSLQKHFDEESKKLYEEIALLIVKLTDEVALVNEIAELSKSQYYEVYASKVDRLNKTLAEAKKEYREGLKCAIVELKARQSAISSTRDFVVPKDCTAKLEGVLVSQRSLRESMSDYTANLDKEKAKARNLLRLNKVYEAESIHGFIARKCKIDKLSKEKNSLCEKVNSARNIITNKVKEIEDLQKSLRDEHLAAQLINDYLAFQEVNGLRLKVEDGQEGESGPRTTFKIYRGDVPAYNLSEGERSVIAFCYFLARLKSEASQAIVVIDDPISSLDANHIYYVYSLIRGVILKESLCSQLVVLTHNLDFLKYLKRLAISGTNRQNAWLLVENLGDNGNIRTMPKHMREFITEFNYLFERIYNCAIAELSDDDYAEKVYGFGNSARKFLELYLYFRFPEGEAKETLAKNRHMKELFGDEVASFMIDRVLNEGSHLVGRLERASSPVDQAEMKDVAKKILAVIKGSDAEQYKALLRSIGKEQRDPISS